MARNTRNYPKTDSESLHDTIKTLKSRIRKLQKETRELRSENKTLLDAWAKAESFLQEVTQGVPLEDLLKYKTLPRKMVKDLEDDIEDIDEKEEVRLKWKNWREENL